MAQTKQSAHKTPATKTPSTPPKRAPRKKAKPAQRDTVIPAAQSADTSPPRPRGKLGDLLTAVESKTGATLNELSESLGWQPHTARAAITRLRQRGYAIALTDENGRKAYRVQEA